MIYDLSSVMWVLRGALHGLCSSVPQNMKLARHQSERNDACVSTNNASYNSGTEKKCTFLQGNLSTSSMASVMSTEVSTSTWTAKFSNTLMSREQYVHLYHLSTHSKALAFLCNHPPGSMCVTWILVGHDHHQIHHETRFKMVLTGASIWKRLSLLSSLRRNDLAHWAGQGMFPWWMTMWI